MSTLPAVIAALVLSLAAAPASHAEEIPPLGAIAKHDHKPVRVHSRPVIERLPLKVIEPVDLRISSDGCVFVADKKAECVFRLDQHGSASVMIERLPGIVRIQLDEDDSVYILTSTSGESVLHQVTPNGQHIILHTFSFPASSFVRDDVGRFVVSVKQSGRLVALSEEGEVSDMALLMQPVTDLVLNAGGQLEALVPSGHIIRIAEDGKAAVSGYAEIGSRRLASLADGSLLALTGSLEGRSQVVFVSRDEERPEQLEVAATVPNGTMAVGFDSLGNLCLANPDLRAVTKVTSNFKIACPHCGKSTRMIFSMDPDPAEVTTTRSF
jgi:hypothetical protein